MLDLLIIGGLTVDRFGDGSVAGGTVIHATRAAAARGVRIGIVTASGEEPAAVAGLAELRGLAAVVERQPREHSATFRHRASRDGRRLWLEHVGGPVAVDQGTRDRVSSGAILFAPVLGEIRAAALTGWNDVPRRGAILQGWLRSTDEGAEVRPLPLSALGPELIEALSGFDLLIASREDLMAESEAPQEQLTALRRAFGRAPDLIVTDGTDGIWLDTQPAWAHQSSRRHLPVPFRVEAESAVGAGDIIAGILTMESEDSSRSIDLRAQDAMQVVAEVLEERRLPRR